MAGRRGPERIRPMLRRGFDRREFLASATAAMAGALGACSTGPTEPPSGPARLTARPGLPNRLPIIGFSALGLRNPFTERDRLIYVPANYRSESPAPLLIMLHGGGRNSSDWETPDLAALADSLGAVVLAPDSRSHGTWDILESGNYDTDIPFLGQALGHTFNQCRIDPPRVALGGFSDGAGAALSYGLANGDFTRAVMAFSRGFLDDRYLRGMPRFFVSHGSEDPVLSFATTRDILVPFLRGRQLTVQWVPFQGGHTIPEAIGVQAFAWLGAGWG